MEDICTIAIPRRRYDKLMHTPKARLLFEERCDVVIGFEPDNAISIKGKSDKVFFAKDVIRAYGNGFSLSTSLQLTNEYYSLMVIDLKEFTNRKNQLKRIKSRLIGTNGKAKKTLETLSACRISVKGRKVSAIGTLEDVEHLRKAIIDLIDGKKHGTVYSYLEKMNRIKKINSLLGQMHVNSDNCTDFRGRKK